LTILACVHVKRFNVKERRNKWHRNVDRDKRERRKGDRVKEEGCGNRTR
jgi:hypothetical protein